MRKLPRGTPKSLQINRNVGSFLFQMFYRNISSSIRWEAHKDRVLSLIVYLTWLCNTHWAYDLTMGSISEKLPIKKNEQHSTRWVVKKWNDLKMMWTCFKFLSQLPSFQLHRGSTYISFVISMSTKIVLNIKTSIYTYPGWSPAEHAWLALRRASNDSNTTPREYCNLCRQPRWSGRDGDDTKESNSIEERHCYSKQDISCKRWPVFTHPVQQQCPRCRWC